MKKIAVLVLVLFSFTKAFAGETQIGTSFSKVQCEYLGINWEQTYEQVLDEGFSPIRLGAYWSEIEKEINVYNFDVLDLQIKKAKEKNLPVILTVGMKAPRWPEYFIPEWLLEKVKLPYGKDVSKSFYLRKQTLKFISKTVNRYKNEKNIKYWQVENEALNRSGAKFWYIGKDFLKEEVELVRKLDTYNRPIILTTATYPNKILQFVQKLFVWNDPLPENLKMCDILGINIYPIIGQKIGPFKLYFRTTRNERRKVLVSIVARVHKEKKDLWVTELQADPWTPGELVYLKKDNPVTICPEWTKEYFEEVRQLGIKTVLFWGVEYWIYRKIKFGDISWEEMFSSIVK